jgi:hypothetical protein
MVREVHYKARSMRFVVSIGILLLSSCVFGATLEKLSVDQMAQQSSLIVRGKITGCAGEARGSVIYTRCFITVNETWKGTPKSQVDFIVPGGRVRSLSQTFTGTPKFNANEQYVLFLWIGKSGVPQIIGLSQGVFDVSVKPSGETTVRREATSEVMLDSKGNQVKDEALNLSMTQLRSQVKNALAGGAQ